MCFAGQREASTGDLQFVTVLSYVLSYGHSQHVQPHSPCSAAYLPLRAFLVGLTFWSMWLRAPVDGCIAVRVAQNNKERQQWEQDQHARLAGGQAAARGRRNPPWMQGEHHPCRVRSAGAHLLPSSCPPVLTFLPISSLNCSSRASCSTSSTWAAPAAAAAGDPAAPPAASPAPAAAWALRSSQQQTHVK
jgi:hypothetical protein